MRIEKAVRPPPRREKQYQLSGYRIIKWQNVVILNGSIDTYQTVSLCVIYLD